MNPINLIDLGWAIVRGSVEVMAGLFTVLAALWAFGGKIKDLLNEHFVVRTEHDLIEKGHESVHERLSSAALRSSDSIARVFDRLDKADEVANSNQNRISKLEGYKEGQQEHHA